MSKDSEGFYTTKPVIEVVKGPQQEHDTLDFDKGMLKEATLNPAIKSEAIKLEK